ncbi:MAG: hypothetical protein Q4C13_06635 [Clostridia bacterium]|nr:hypothetical protein [Clostridia bacterium]
MPVAAALVAALLLFSIPGVSRAVKAWLGIGSRLSEYMADPPEAREDNADIAAAVTSPSPARQSYAIRWLDETEYCADVDAWRTEHGFKAFSREDYAWVADIEPQVSEMLYDGRNLIVRSFMKNAGAARFLGGCGGEGEDFDLYATGSASCLAGGAPYDAFECLGGGITLQAYYDRESKSYDMAALEAAGGVYVQTELIGAAAPAFPDGPVELTIEMWLMDGSIDDMGTVGLVAIIEQTLHFDASAGNAGLGRGAVVNRTFQGEAPVTVWGRDGTIENRMLDMSGVAVTAAMTTRATGLPVSLSYTLREDDEEHALWWALALGAVGRSGIEYEALIDGRSIGTVYIDGNGLDEREDPVLEIPLTASELAEARTLTLRPSLRYLAAYSLESGERADAVEMPFGEPLRLSDFYEFYESFPLTGCEIIFPLGGDA